ncbi:MAG: hypothetical protein ACYC2O_10455 [Microthrixaceae bacterium]
MQTSLDDATLEANAYAVAYRLLGDRPAARAVSGIATQRLRQLGDGLPPDWLARLTEFTIEQTVGPASLGVDVGGADPKASLRAALRRRLERATTQERVAAALVHLAGYATEFVGPLLGVTPERAGELARVLAPPPGVAYRDLGDPELTGRAEAVAPSRRRRRRRPHWTTILAIVAILLAVLYATQVTGPRPTLVDEGSLGASTSSAATTPGGPAAPATAPSSGAPSSDLPPSDALPSDLPPSDALPSDARPSVGLSGTPDR